MVIPVIAATCGMVVSPSHEGSDDVLCGQPRLDVWIICVECLEDMRLDGDFSEAELRVMYRTSDGEAMNREDDESGPLTLDAGDVSVVEKDPAICDSCGEAATHYVMIEMRGNGSKSAVAECCKSCAEDFAADLRKSLPPEKPE